jgi:hypothetical protein
MKHVIYDPATGKILARVLIGGPDQDHVFSPHRVAVDGEDFDSEPEKWAEVDTETQTLRPQPGKVDPTSKARRRADNNAG